MKIRAISLFLCLCLAVQLLPTIVYSQEASELDENSPEVVETSEPVIDPDILDITSYTAISSRTVQDILDQSKFTARQGHGFAAERGNNLADRIKGKNAIVVGDNNVKNGPDRMILERDGTIIWIQDKYYASAKAGIDACFDEQGNFRYFDGNNNPIPIEVPNEQYDEAVQIMRTRIAEGRVPGGTNPDEAETLVRKGALTYNQAKNLAKAGTLDSLIYDMKNGVVTATCSFGISTLLNFAVCIRSGETVSDALKFSAKEGLKTGGLVFCTSVLAGQLTKSGLMNVFKPSSEALVNALGDDFAKALLEVTKGAAAGEAASQTIAQQATKVIQAQALTAVVTIIVFSVPDAIDLFRGRISKTQFAKDFVVTAASVVGGAVGGTAGGLLGNAIVQGAGGVIGSAAGALVGSGATGWAVDQFADYLASDDAEKLYQIIQDYFVQECEDYLVNEEEAQVIANQLNDMLDEDMFKDMYQSANREQFIRDKLDPLFQKVAESRPKIEAPTEEELRSSLKEELQGVAFIH